MIFVSFLLIIFIYKYILVLLILVELIVVNIALIIFIILIILQIEFIIIYYLVFRVCERVLGLGLIVRLVRFRKRDLYYIFNIRKF